MNLSQWHHFLSNRISGITLSLKTADLNDTLFRKALRAVGAPEGYTLTICQPSLSDIGQGRFVLSGTDAEIKRDQTSGGAFSCPINGFAFQLTCTETTELNAESIHFQLIFTQPFGTMCTLGTLFPHMADMRVNNNGALARVDSPIKSIFAKDWVFSYNTAAPDAPAESDKDDSPQPVIINGQLLLSGSRFWDEHPYLPEHLTLTGADPEIPSQMRFFEQNDPSFNLYARIAEPFVGITGIGIHIHGMGLFLTNRAFDSYSHFDEIQNASRALLFWEAELTAKKRSIALDFSTDLSLPSGLWEFKAVLSEGLSLNQGIGFLLDAFDGPLDTELLPAEVWLFNCLKLHEISIKVKSDGLTGMHNGFNFSVLWVNIIIISDEKWVTPLPYVTFDQVGIHICLTRADSGFSISGNLFSTLGLFNDAVQFETVLKWPSLDLNAVLKTKTDLSLGTMLSHYLGTPPAGLPSGLTLSNAHLSAVWAERNFTAEFTVEGRWGLSLGATALYLESIEAALASEQGNLQVSVLGYITLSANSGSDTTVLSVGATYDETGWSFIGQLHYGQLEVVDFVAGFFGTPPPWVKAWVPSITVTDLILEYSTQAGNPFLIQGRLSVDIPFELLGTRFSTAARVMVRRTAEGIQGDIAGLIKIGKFTLEVSAAFANKSSTPVYTIRIMLDQTYISAVLSTANGHQVLKISLGNMTVGELIQFFGRMVNPNYDFTLGDSWSMLTGFQLTGTELVFDPTDKCVSFSYPVNRDFSVANIKTLGLRYQWGIAAVGFDIIITGSFIGQSYTDQKPLTWDVMNDPPPSQSPGNSVFALNYLALGQHVWFSGYESGNVASIISAMKTAMQPAKDPQKSPFGGQTLRFDKTAGMIFALDAVVAGFVSLQIAFKTPNLYAGTITVGSNGGGAFSGLALHLLYTAANGVGCFSVECVPPAKFRKFELGAMSVTVGTIKVSVYTNGGFVVDLGYPHNSNFSRSFSFNLLPFTGAGGLYFGVINNVPYQNLPTTSKGVFSPIVLFGVGFSIGKAASVNAGIFSARAGVSMNAMVEGLLAWFEHNDKSREKEMYYYLSGSVGVSANVSGTVDFFIVAASVGLNLSCNIRLTLRSYSSTEINMNFRVEAYASVRFLFWTAEYSFKSSISLSFTIGSNKKAPWNTNRAINIDLGRAVRVSDSETLICVKLLPFFTADNIPVLCENAAALPEYRVAFLPGICPDSLEPLITAFLDLTLLSCGNDTVITRRDLQSMEETLQDVNYAVRELTLDKLFAFFRANGLKFRIIGSEENDTEGNYTIFPMPPVLSAEWIDYSRGGTVEERDYSTYSLLDDAYISQLRELYGMLFNGTETDGNDTEMSAAAYVFRSYFYMLLRATVRNSLEVLSNRHHKTEPGDTPAGLCAHYPTVEAHYPFSLGDTAENAAEYFEMPVAGLRYLNPTLEEQMKAALPGDQIPVRLGLSPHTLLRANPNSALRPGTEVLCDLLRCECRYGNDIASIVTHVGGDIPKSIAANLHRKGIFIPYKPFLSQKDMVYALPHSLLLDIWAAIFYIRLYRFEPDELMWYYDAISLCNEGIDNELPEAVFVPAAHGGYGAEQLIRWTVLNGDTLKLIAAYCALYQNAENYAEFVDFRGKVRAANRHFDAREFVLPAGVTLYMLPEETMGDFAVRLLIPAENTIPMLLDFLGNQPVLDAAGYIYAAESRIQLIENDTVQRAADRYRITTDEFAGHVKDTALFEAAALNIPFLYAIDRSELSAIYREEGIIDNIGNILSRFMMNGQRLPDAFTGDETVWRGLYEKTGQQFTGTAPVQTPDILLAFRLRKNPGDFAFIELQTEAGEEFVSVEISGQTLWDNYPALYLNARYHTKKQADVVTYHCPRYRISEFISLDSECGVLIGKLPGSVISQADKNLTWALERVCPEGAEEPYNGYAFASVFAFRTARVEGQSGMYGLLGVENRFRDILTHLYQTDDDFTVHILCRPQSAAGQNALVELPVQSASVLKINLSVKSDLSYGKLPNESLPFYSGIDDSKNFIRLLWESDITGGTGFFLRCEAGEDLTGPDGFTEVWFLCIENRNNHTVSRGRNCAILYDFFDTTSQTLYLQEAPNGAPQITEPLYTTDAGTLSYELQLYNETDAQGDTVQDSHEILTRNIFNLSSYLCETHSCFNRIAGVLPIAPLCMNDDRTLHYYRHNIPIAKEVTYTTYTPAPGLPDPADDPYRHIAYTYEHELSDYHIVISNQWNDLLGNQSMAEPEALTLSYGYADELLSVTAWPSLLCGYRVEKNASESEAAFYLTLKTADFMPAPDQTASLMQRPEENTYQKIYYQINQPDLEIYGTTALNNYEKIPLSKAQLVRFAAAAYQYVETTALAVDVYAVSPTIAELCRDYGTDMAHLARANEERAFYPWFADKNRIVLPKITMFHESGCLTELFSDITEFSNSYNNGLPLHAGVCIHIAPFRIPFEEASSLAKAAEQASVSVGSLIRNNAERKGIIIPDTVFEHNGFTVTATLEDSFETLAHALQKAGELSESGFSGEGLAYQYAETDVLLPECRLYADEYRIQENESLLLLSEKLGEPLDALVSQNQNTRNLYPAGTPIHTGFWDKQSIAMGVYNMSLKDAAKALDISMTQILLFNSDLTLNGGENTLVVPGHVLIPTDFDGALTDAAHCSFGTLAQKYETDAVQLAYANGCLADILRPGTVVRVEKDGTESSVTIGAYYTLDMLPPLFSIRDISLRDIVLQNQEVPLFLEARKLLLPPMTVLRGTLQETYCYSTPLFALNTRIVISRNKVCMHPALQDESLTAMNAVSECSPYLTETYSLIDFAQELQTVYPALWLCQSGGEQNQLTAVVMGESYIQHVEVAPFPVREGESPVYAPFYFALRPLSLSLTERTDVSIPVIEADGRINPEKTERISLENIDMEAWATAFLDDADKIISHSVMFRLCQKQETEVYAKRLAELKQHLAEAISGGVGAIYLPQALPEDMEKRIAAASAEIQQALLRSLSDGYRTDVLIQYDMEVNVGEKGELPFHLTGGAAFGKDAVPSAFDITGGRLEACRNGLQYCHFQIVSSGFRPQAQIDLRGLVYTLQGFEHSVKVSPGGYSQSACVAPITMPANDAVQIRLDTPADAPLVLREYPAHPVLSLCEYGYDKEQYARVLLWDCRYSFSVPTAPQDKFIMQISCNNDGFHVQDKEEDLFSALAGYTALSKTVSNVLLSDHAEESAYENTLQSYLTLAETVCDRWREHWQSPAANCFVPGDFSITQTTTYIDGEPEFLLECQKNAHAVYDLPYPAIECGESEAHRYKLIITQSGPGWCKYRFENFEETGIDITKISVLQFAYTFEDLNIIEIRSARMSARVIRNSNYRMTDIPFDELFTVNEDFVYTTPIVSQPDVTLPILRVDTPLYGGRWTQGEGQSNLAVFFERLDEGRLMDCVVSYSYDNTGFTVTLPVCGRLGFHFQKDSTLQELLHAVENWKTEVSPSCENGQWHFSLCVYEGADTVSSIIASYPDIYFDEESQ